MTKTLYRAKYPLEGVILSGDINGGSRLAGCVLLNLTYSMYRNGTEGKKRRRRWAREKLGYK